MLARVEFGFLVRSRNAVRWHGPIWTLLRAVFRSKGEEYKPYLARSQDALGRLMETRWHCSGSSAWKIEDNLDVIITTFHILFCFDYTSHTTKARRALSVPLGTTFACPAVLLQSKPPHAFFCASFQSRSLSAILASPNWASTENLILQSCDDPLIRHLPGDELQKDFFSIVTDCLQWVILCSIFCKCCRVLNYHCRCLAWVSQAYYFRWFLEQPALCLATWRKRDSSWRPINT